MPKNVGIYEAKTNLSSLIERVERGDRIVITRNGVPVAELGPVRAVHAEPGDVAKAIIGFRQRQMPPRGKLRSKGETLRDLAHAGHAK